MDETGPAIRSLPPSQWSHQRGRHSCGPKLTACPGRIERTVLYTLIPAAGGTESGRGQGSVFLYILYC